MLDKKDIDNAINTKYSDFSDAVKVELHNKLSNHPEVKQYASEFDKIQRLKAIFSEIDSVSGE